MKSITLYASLLALTLLSACSSVDDHSSANSEDLGGNSGNVTEENFTEDQAGTVEPKSHNEQVLVHQNVTRLANKLFSSATNIHLSQTVAIGTFLPIHLTNEPNLAEQNYIGLQIQESFITLAAQAGLNVVEFKTASAIKITANADVMLSRDVKDLQSNVDAQYFLTGTYSEHDNKLIVNARIIELSNQRVIAAATDYIAKPSLNNKQKITMKNNMLYRKAF